MNRFQDVFISYGRADSKFFAKKLNDCLVAQGLEVWFDFDDIPLGVDYQKQIDDGIDKADNVLFIISPHAVNSPYCRLEVELALKRQKRIIPLLHVEQISRKTWQQRFPQATEVEWKQYCSQGLHSSFPNLHPEIARINWVHFRDGVDDFERSLADLLNIFARDRAYVHQHTYFLIKALEWERNHRDSRFLLIGEERTQGEKWLKTRFQDKQPPCLPTDLHCEFLTESLKNANNLMTQVFISWSDKDRALMEPIRRRLLREGFTVWVNKTDIQTGANFQQVIERGIEEADNIVYLISPDSLESSYCQQEIQYALRLNKRVIPLLVRPTDLDRLPSELRTLQFINFADNTTSEQYERDIDKLLRILNQDAAYFEEHKILLTKALKWERQQRNPSILLRGYNLRHAEAWLKLARCREQHRPIALLGEFIESSLQQPSGVPLDVFISYSRKDSEFARRLNDALQLQGKTTWFDQESIAAGSADFEQEIYRGIENADHFLFILSPNAIESPYCAGEVEYATQLHKRILTVLAQPIDPARLPPGLASVQWVDFSQHEGDFAANFSAVLRTLDTDPEYLRTHTRLLTRALEWDSRDRDESLLLRGSTLKEIQQWLLSTANKTPPPTRLQRDYVTASNATEIRRQKSALRLQRIGLGVISTISLAAIALGLTAFKQYKAATQLQIEAQKGHILAQTRTSEALFQSNRPFQALLEAMRSGIELKHYHLTDSTLRTNVLTALQQAVFWVQESQQFASQDGIIWSVSVSPNGKMVASASADGMVKVWRRDGTLINQIASPNREPALAVGFSPDNKRLVIGSSSEKGDKGHAEIVQLETWVHTPLSTHKGPINGVAFSPDGQQVATASEDGLVRVFDLNGTLLRTLAGHDAPVRSVAYSPEGELIASASDDRTLRLWRRNGTLIKTLTGHTAQVRSVSFSPNGQLLASASWDETIRLWKRDGTPVRTIEGHNTLVHDVRFSPDGKTLASASWDKTVKQWTLDGTLIATLTGHSAQVRSLSFGPDGTLASAGGDRTVRLWRLNRPLLATLQDHRARVYSVVFSPDDRLIASAGADNTIRLWNRKGQPLQHLPGHQSVIWSLSFSPDGKTLASASSDYTVKLWTRTGKLLNTLIGHAGPVYSVEFSPDGTFLASTGADHTVRLWRKDGIPIRTLQTSKKGLLAVSISPDNRTLATAGWNNEVELWTLEGKRVTQLVGHQGWVYSVEYSHDGQQILTASYDNTAKLWTRDGTLITTLTGHEDGIVAAHFSPDDRYLATASHDGTVKLWKRDGTLITTLRGHRDRLNDVAFSRDGTLLATASDDRTILLWELSLQGELDKLLAQGCQWTRDYLTTHEQVAPMVRHYCHSIQPQHLVSP